MIFVKKVKEFLLNKSEIFMVIGLVLFISVLVIALLFRNNIQPNSQIVDQPTINILGDKVLILKLENTKVLTLADKKITLPDGWEATSFFQNTEDVALRCTIPSQINCRVYVINNGKYNFYISNPTALNFKTDLNYNYENKVFAVNDKIYNFTYEYVTQVSRTDESEGGASEPITDKSKRIHSQVYGCLSESICLSSGRLMLDLDTNKKEVEFFETLLKQLTVE